jgi:hypothetical protein
MNKVIAAALIVTSCVLGSGLVAFGLFVLLTGARGGFAPLNLLILVLPAIGLLIGLIAALHIMRS